MNTPKISQQLKTETLKQPVTCPWVANQPYPSSLANKNRNSGQKRNSNVQTNNCHNNHWEPSFQQNGCAVRDNSYTSMQQSSNQFFLFLRLMQLFPHTHPATLHSVLYICKNDFFCAIDKLLYAKRCRLLYNNRKNQIQQQRATEKFTVLNHSVDVNPLKRSFLKCRTEDENYADKEAKRLKISGDDILLGKHNVDVCETVKEKATELGDKLSDPEKHVEPGTIKFITIKTNCIQEKVNAATLENLKIR